MIQWKNCFNITKLSFWTLIALQDMLPTIMSQMGLAPSGPVSAESGRRPFGTRGDKQPGDEQTEANEQAAADADDDVPGKKIVDWFERIRFIYI